MDHIYMEDYQSSSMETKAPAEFDMHCPEMGGKEVKQLNFWKERCKVRQDNEANRRTCWPYCKMQDREYYPTNKPAASYKEVASLKKKGLKHKEIADRLGVSLPSIGRYVAKAKKKGLL